MMLFKNHKTGFILSEVVLALAIIGISLTSIMQLQFNVTQRIIFNNQTCHNLLEIKKNLYHFFIEENQPKTSENTAEIKKINISLLEKYKRLSPYKITKSWNTLSYQQEIEMLFFTLKKEKDDQK